MEEVNFHEQYATRNRTYGSLTTPRLPANIAPVGFKFGNTTMTSQNQNGYNPLLPNSFVPQQRFSFGMPPNRFQFGQQQNHAFKPQQFGNRLPQFGYRPQLGSNTQFGFRPQLEPQRQFGYKPPQIGFKPPQFHNNPQQFGYKPPQLQGSRFQETDVSMRTAVPRSQPQTPQQSFRLNELTLGNDDLQDYYDTYNNDGYEHDTTYRMYDYDSNLIDYNDESEGWKNEDLHKTEGENFHIEASKREREIIELNCDPNLKLPYIYIPEINAKLMIDTGSTRSFMSPRIAYKYFSEYIRHEPFQVISTHASSRHDETIVIPLLPTFNTTDYHKFHLYDVDERYEGLIGNDLLKQLDAIIDLKHLMLRTKTTCIPIINNLNYVIKLQPRTEQRVKIPTDIYSGEAIVNFVEFTPGLRMPSALVNCVNGYALTVIQNTLEVPYTITITKPFTVMKYDMTECNLNFSDHNTTIDTNKLLRDNLQRLRLDHMNDEERSKILNLCNEYKDIFYCDQIPLSFTNQVKHKIRTKNEDPIYVRPYRQAPSQAAEINRQIEKLLKDNVIQESHSPWNAPVHLVPKKGDASGEIKWRMVIDYRRLNEITIDDRYPLPNIIDLFDKLGKSLYFTTLDLASGYHQIEVEEQDREKTAFSTQHGHYEFLRMPFGLKTAPATFQRTMDNVLRGLQGLHCMVYLDDVIVFSTSLGEHIHKLQTVFERLRQTNLKVQLDKSEFLRKEVIYLGHTITKDGLRPNDDKIAAVMNYPIPKTTTEIKSFLGLIGYYRRFIKDFAHVTKPLTSCLKKRNKIIMDQNYVDAFNRCKELLTHAPLLQYPDYDKTFILTTDASNVALGAVLSQGPIGSDKPVAYASRTLSDTEARYSTIERECLAIVWAIKHFRPYLYGRKFIIYTDHKPLAWLDSYKDTSSKLTRWRLRLQDFDYEIIYEKGNQNSNADALSRIKVNATNSDNEGHSMVVNIDNEKLTTKQRTERNDSSTLSISDHPHSRFLIQCKTSSAGGSQRS
ncbi:unnamed protein product [Euphydryas editha]|uniref:RNA-directed DNA polymerase n=1 Tax=Euphydryas editha TaxID=104508 RepID=A0AAU9V463_EUPED|nr:unnamed protein product [Euphydryas editha]